MSERKEERVPYLHDMGQLSKPILNVLLERYGNKSYKVSVASMQGYRKDMEDSHCISLSLPHREKMSVFGVFDGHGGANAAKFCEEHFIDHIGKINSLSPDEIQNAVLLLDDTFLSQHKADSGCTATFCIINEKENNDNNDNNNNNNQVQNDHHNFHFVRNNNDDQNDRNKNYEKRKNYYELAIGNIGDSRTILMRNDGDLLFCTRDHRPDDRFEKKRIVNAKGAVFRHRIAGSLALSRAIGDKEFKENPSLPSDQQQVIAVPDISFFTAEEGDIIILCCDGIFEYISNEQKLARYLAEQMKKNEDTAGVLHELLLNCIEGSGDNMTIMVVQFTDGSNYNRGKTFIKGPYFVGANDFAFAYEKNIQMFSHKL